MPDLLTDLGEFWETGTAVASFQIVDSAGNNFQPESLFLTLTDEASGSTCNSRNGSADILSGNCVGGLVTFKFTPADMALLNTLTRKVAEVHRAVFRWKFNSAADWQYRVFTFTVRPLVA